MKLIFNRMNRLIKDFTTKLCPQTSLALVKIVFLIIMYYILNGLIGIDRVLTATVVCRIVSMVHR